MCYKKIFIVIFSVGIATSLWAEKHSTKDCLNKVKPGTKAWQVIQYCGKPPKVAYEQKKTDKPKIYQVYQYPISETICYTMPKQVNVICDAGEKGNVSFYFDNNILKQIKINNKKISDLFLKFNQKIVLGDTDKHLFSLWKKPEKRMQKKLMIPTIIEHWQYKNVSFILTNGVVTEIPQNGAL